MIVLGRIADAHSIRGWVRVHPFADDPGAWAKLEHWWLAPQDDGGAGWSERAVEQARWANGKLDVKLAGVDDRTAAEALKGWFVGVPREALPEPGDGEYYWADLLGADVVNLAGEPLGRVSELIETGANAVLVVLDGERRTLVPFVAPILDAVDLSARQIRVDWQRDW